MIDPTYLAIIRQQMRCELVLTLVQLEQLAPMWWPSQDDMAQQLGTTRRTLTTNLQRLESQGLIKRLAIGKTGGTWIWWVKRCPADKPQAENEPAWTLRDIHTRTRQRVTISKRWEWASQHEIPKPTMQSFLGGHQLTLRRRWQVVGSPWDLAEVAA